MAERYAQLADHPLVGSAEICGLMGALRLVQPTPGRAPFPAERRIGMLCRAHWFDVGIVMRALGDRMIVAPPLVITRAQIDDMVALIRRALDLTLDDVRAVGRLR